MPEEKKAKAPSTTNVPNTQTFKKMCVNKYENYTPLNGSREVITQETFNLELVQLLQLTPSPFVDPAKWCSCHQNQGHTTKDVIEYVI